MAILIIFVKKIKKTADFFSKREIFARILVGIYQPSSRVPGPASDDCNALYMRGLSFFLDNDKNFSDV